MGRLPYEPCSVYSRAMLHYAMYAGSVHLGEGLIAPCISFFLLGSTVHALSIT